MAKQQQMTGLQQENPEVIRALTAVEGTDSEGKNIIFILNETEIDSISYPVTDFNKFELVGFLESIKQAVLFGKDYRETQ